MAVGKSIDESLRKAAPRPQEPATGRHAVIKKRKRGLAALWQHQTFRRASQITFAAFIALTAVQHTLLGEAGETGPNATASAEAFCPLGGLETLYRFVTGGGKFVPHTHLSNIVLLVAVLVTALLARNAFCGWVCPLGFLQDMVSGFSRFLQKRIRPLRRGVKFVKTRLSWLAVIDRPLRLLKYAVLVWAVGGAAIFGVMVFRDYDPWSALLSIGEWSLGPGLVVLGVLLVASFFVDRPWCRYACPLGAATGLVARFSPVHLKRSETACKACSVCTKACPMGLPVATAAKITSPDCIGCLECVGACPRSGALDLHVGLPINVKWPTRASAGAAAPATVTVTTASATE